jgi:protein ImuB
MRLAYLHLPRFPLQRLVLEQPSFAGKPVVLLEDVKGAERVRFVSRAASALGARLGQTGAAAAATVPGLEKRRFDAEAEWLALRSLGEALLVVAPGFELDAPEGLWLDASAANLSGGEAAWREAVLARCAAAGLRAKLVVGSERFTTQAVGRFGEATVLPPGGGGAFAATPLDALACAGVVPAVLGPLKALGLSTLGELAALPVGSLAARFGTDGHLVGQLARGQDESRLSPEVLPEVIDEAVALDWPAEQLEPVLFALKMVVDRVCARLQGRQLAAVRLSVGLMLDGAGLQALPLVLARPASHGKLLLELIRHRLTDLSVQHPIAGVRVLVEEACPEPGRQLLLGDAPAGDAQLEVVLSKLQSALGEAALFSAEPMARHRPEAAWRLVPFRPPDAGRPSELWGAVDAGWTLGGRAPAGEASAAVVADRQRTNDTLALLPPAPTPPSPEGEAPRGPWEGPRGRAAPGPNEAAVMDVIAGLSTGVKWRTAKAKVTPAPVLHEATLQARPPKLFREPVALHADVTSAGTISFVTLQGRRRRVEAMEGPERLVGQWWTPDAVARDYYRVRLEGVGVLWVFKDAADGRFYAHGLFD